jgi:tetratricopeptide (TPR) repeat protein
LFGDMDLTRELLEEAESLSLEFNDLFGLENTLRELGKLETAAGNLERAAQAFHRCIAVCREIGADWEGELTHCDLGILLRVQGKYDAAEETFRRALAAAIATKNRWWLPRCKAEMGCLARDRKQYELAAELTVEALDLWEQMQHEPFYAWGRAQLGHIAFEEDGERTVDARNHYRHGLELALKHKQAPLALNIFTGSSRLLVQGGERQKARELLALVIGHPAGTYETKQWARTLRADLNADPAAETVATAGQTPDWQATAETLVAHLGMPA